MMNKVELLNFLLNFDKSLLEIVQPLNTYDWDSDHILTILKREHIINILKRYLNNELSTSDVENWVNAIEGREDIGYESNFEEILSDLLYELANPLLTRPLSKDFAREWLKQLEDSTSVSITA